ncbi:MAG: L-aspartate oxidase [Lentimicrobiaceae bacterium]|nr:L-aspartate oxidase [Lentimicrobiaceae bacterium]MCB9024460.1 L-aspartate oxidase [Lentimicrobiaceae bacterium]MCO5265136.1 L-aspartate oxidase [Lentimicrobium sp.]
MRKKVDFLVIGTGIAGLSYALKVSAFGKVIIVTKSEAEESATRYAQGGIAAVMYTPDTYEKHIKDTMIAGDDLSDPEIVRITITESTDRVKELIDWGVAFDKNPTGMYDLAKEGGHSEFRVLHHKDQTGAEIESILLQRVKENKNIEILENHFAVDIITEHHLDKEADLQSDITCYGAYVLNKLNHQIITILAKTTMLATGGAGNVYATTTNPPVATGDGIAMVSRAQGENEKMEFIQFHPTSLYNPAEKPSFLITEALRGSGAILKTRTGKEFMQKYDARLSLAPRDIVARAIDNELKISGDDYVCLDARHLDMHVILNHFPAIYAKCLSIGIDMTKEMIPVVPAAHYTCGGIKVDAFARSTIHHLYASGECASTGLHGANRLASNSLLESLVFSHRASLDAIEKIKNIRLMNEIPDWNASGTVFNEEMILITQSLKELQGIMTNYVGIVRSNLRLKRAYDRLQILQEETEDLYEKSVLTEKICELRNMITVAGLIIQMAMERKESRGLHHSIDYPKQYKTE